MRKYFLSWLVVFVFVFGISSVSADDQPKPAFQHVILISIDGLRPDAISRLGPKDAPAFHAIMRAGVSTLNARTDFDYTQTMPDHLCMLTSVGVLGERGHNYTINYEDPRTFHEVRGKYLPVIFNVIHDNQRRSAFFAAKSKFMAYPRSYGAKGIAPQTNMDYQGKYTIDAYRVAHSNDDLIVAAFLKELTQSSPDFIFLHLAGADDVGHAEGWNVRAGSSYMKQVKKLDGFIGKILSTIKKNKELAETTAVIVTADHGGFDYSHLEATDRRAYTIPFLVWGKGVARGSDLYVVNPRTRKDPGAAQIPYDAPGQPIRNGDAANLALSLLGLPPIPDSTINHRQDLNVFLRSYVIDRN